MVGDAVIKYCVRYCFLITSLIPITYVLAFGPCTFALLPNDPLSLPGARIECIFLPADI